jgi:hypothetical protein
MKRQESEDQALSSRRTKRSRYEPPDVDYQDLDAMELALRLIISEGYLYRYDCRSVAAACRRWNHVWQEIKDDLPDWASIEVLPLEQPSPPPAWMKEPALLTSHKFLRRIFEQVRDLKVAAKPSKKKRAKAKDELPKWEDYEVAIITIVESSRPRRRITGPAIGYHIDLGMKRHVIHSDHPLTSEANMLLKPDFSCQLYADFRLMAGIRCWRVYDGKPLWP